MEVVRIIDIHCHLSFKQYAEDRESVIEGAKKELRAVVTSGVEPSDAKEALNIARNHKDFVFVTLGMHPIHVEEFSSAELERYEEFIYEHRREIIGIGEVGLDYHWIKEPLKQRRVKEVFLRFLEIARDLRLPVVLHLRGATGSSAEAIEEGLKAIEDEDIQKAVFHCFTGKPALASEICDEGYFISLPATIKRSKTMKNVAKRMPISQLLTETDAPYLSPVENQERNVPQNVKFAYEEIAKVRKISVEELKEQVRKNFSALFGVVV